MPSTREHVVAYAHVAVVEGDPGLAQAREVQLGPAPLEVVERDELPVRMTRGEADGEVGADEAGATGEEDAHGGGS